jgi:hypothetical protein
MKKVKRLADGVIFSFNGYDRPPANKVGFEVFDDAKPESEPETLNVPLVEVEGETNFPKIPEVAKNVDVPKKEEKPEAKVGLGDAEKTISKYDAEIKKIRGMKTRKQIGDYIDEKYGFNMPGMNRKTSEILKDAENVIYRNLKKDSK